MHIEDRWLRIGLMKKRPPDSGTSALPVDVSRLKGWRKAARVVDPGRVNLPMRRITINLDSDIVAVFKAQALKGGPPYQVASNQALREYLHRREEQAADQPAQTVLAALKDPRVRRKIQALAASRTIARR